MRLIDGDALEELFREVISGIAKKPEMNGNLEHMVRASAMVIEMIQDAPTIEPERKTGRWIPCSERLPELDEDGYSDKVLVCFSNFSGCEVCEYRECDDCHGWYVVDSDDNPEDVGVHVIAWMPLPEPYTESEGEG